VLKRLKTTTDEGFLAMKNFGPQKAREAPLLGIGEEREWWDSDSNSYFFEAVDSHSFQVITGLPDAGIIIAS
jgi:hypothetical protein